MIIQMDVYASYINTPKLNFEVNKVERFIGKKINSEVSIRNLFCFPIM